MSVPHRPRAALAGPLRRRSLLGAGLAVAAGAGLAAAAGPTRAAAVSPRRRHGWITSRLARMSVEQKVGQLFVMHVYGSEATAADDRNLTEYGVATPAEVVTKYHLGGVIYFAWADNLPTPEDGARLSNGLQQTALGIDAAVRIPLTISTDEETGPVSRMPDPATGFPGAMALGAARDPELTEQVYRITGAELRAVGINNDYAPIGDVNVNPANPVIGVRSFASEADLVSELVVAGVTGLQSEQVSATAKHFPGHGDTDTDSHTGFPVITHTREEWEQIDAPPFRAAIEAGIDAIMTAHLNFPALDPSGDPATLSRPVVTGVLREELGFDGVVVTDSLGMAGVREKYGDDEVAVRAVEAGVDVLLNTPAADVQYGAVLDAVRSGRIPASRLDESVYRILGMKFDRGIVDDPFVDVEAVSSVVGIDDHTARAQEITDRTVTLLRDDADLVPLPAGSMYVTGYGDSTTALLGEALGAHGHPATVRSTGSSPTQAEIDLAVRESSSARVTVVTSQGADASTEQQDLVQALRDAGRDVVVVAVGTPYDIAGLGDTPTYLASYGYQPVSIESVAKVLAGEAPAAGRLPVTIPSAEDPDTVLFEFGAGIEQ